MYPRSQLTSDPAFLSLEPHFDGLERPAALLRCPWDSGDVVVDESGDVELQHPRVLDDDVGGGAVDFVLLQLLIRLDDVGEFVGQIVLWGDGGGGGE